MCVCGVGVGVQAKATLVEGVPSNIKLCFTLSIERVRLSVSIQDMTTFNIIPSRGALKEHTPKYHMTENTRHSYQIRLRCNSGSGGVQSTTPTTRPRVSNDSRAVANCRFGFRSHLRYLRFYKYLNLSSIFVFRF